MATPAHHELLGTDEHEAPIRTIGAATLPPAGPVPTSPGMRPVRSPRAGGTARRLGLFFKVFLGDMTIWAVLSGVLAYEVVRRGVVPEHAAGGAGFRPIVALALSMGLQQIANPRGGLKPRPAGIKPG